MDAVEVACGVGVVVVWFGRLLLGSWCLCLCLCSGPLCREELVAVAVVLVVVVVCLVSEWAPGRWATIRVFVFVKGVIATTHRSCCLAGWESWVGMVMAETVVGEVACEDYQAGLYTFPAGVVEKASKHVLGRIRWLKSAVRSPIGVVGIEDQRERSPRMESPAHTPVGRYIVVALCRAGFPAELWLPVTPWGNPHRSLEAAPVYISGREDLSA